MRRAARSLEVVFDSGERFELPAPLLRVMSPSAADRGHSGPALKPLALDKAGVGLTDVTPIGRYAVRIAFDDGHDTGIYTWENLYRIGRDRQRLEAEHAALIATASPDA